MEERVKGYSFERVKKSCVEMRTNLSPPVSVCPQCFESSNFKRLNPLLHMPILRSSNLTANKDMMSKNGQMGMVAYFCHEIRDSYIDNFREVSRLKKKKLSLK